MNIFNYRKPKEPKVMGESINNSIKPNEKLLLVPLDEKEVKPKRANLGFIDVLTRSERVSVFKPSHYSNDLNPLLKSESTSKLNTPISNHLNYGFDIKGTHLHPHRTNNASKSYDIFNYVLPKGKGPRYELTAINMAAKSIEEAVELKQNDEKLSSGKLVARELLEKRKAKQIELRRGFEESKDGDRDDDNYNDGFGDNNNESDDNAAIPLGNIFGQKQAQSVEELQAELLGVMVSSRITFNQKRTEVIKMINDSQFLTPGQQKLMIREYTENINNRERWEEEDKEIEKKESEEKDIIIRGRSGKSVKFSKDLNTEAMTMLRSSNYNDFKEEDYNENRSKINALIAKYKIDAKQKADVEFHYIQIMQQFQNDAEERKHIVDIQNKKISEIIPDAAIDEIIDTNNINLSDLHKLITELKETINIDDDVDEEEEEKVEIFPQLNGHYNLQKASVSEIEERIKYFDELYKSLNLLRKYNKKSDKLKSKVEIQELKKMLSTTDKQYTDGIKEFRTNINKYFGSFEEIPKTFRITGKSGINAIRAKFNALKSKSTIIDTVEMEA